MLIMLLDGLLTGVRQQTRVYLDHAGGNVVVLPPGARIFGDGGQLPLSTAVAIGAAPGVAWATPIPEGSVVMDYGGAKVAANLVGSPPNAPGRAWSLSEGREATGGDEVVVVSIFSRAHGVGVGSQLEVMGTAFRVVGIADHIGGYLNSYFFTHAGGRRQAVPLLLPISSQSPPKSGGLQRIATANAGKTKRPPTR